MSECGATGRRVLRFNGYGGPQERLVHLMCTGDEHEGENHYDATYGVEFGDGLGQVDEDPRERQNTTT